MSVAGLLLVITTAVVFLMLAFVVRRTYPTWWFDTAVALGLLLSLLGWLFEGRSWPAALTVVTRFELGLGSQERLSVSVGDQMPPFQVTTADGAAFTDRDLIAAAPALLVLYRGWWCPYCTTQLDELQREHEAFADAGISVYAVSVDSPDETEVLQGRVGETITFLSDPHGALLDSIGVRDRNGAAWYDRLLYGLTKRDISLPAVLLVEHDGSIRYTYRSPRIDIRPSPQEIIGA